MFVFGFVIVVEEVIEEIKVNKNVEKIVVVGICFVFCLIGDLLVLIDIIGGEELDKGGNIDMFELLKGFVLFFNVY